MKIKTFTTPAAAVRFRNAMAKRHDRVSPVITRGCLARGFTYVVQFS